MYAFSANLQLNKGGTVHIYVAFRCVRITIGAVEKHKYYILCVCVCVCVSVLLPQLSGWQIAHFLLHILFAPVVYLAPPQICTCGLSSSTIDLYLWYI
jgi:hypothetical protein